MGITFKNVLKKSGMTAYRLSKESGVNYSKINRLINGKIQFRNLTLETALKLAETLGVDVKEIENIDVKEEEESKY